MCLFTFSYSVGERNIPQTAVNVQRLEMRECWLSMLLAEDYMPISF